MLLEGWELWKNNEFCIKTLFNPHISQEEGIHLIVQPNKKIAKGWDNPELCGRAFSLASKVAKIIMEKLKIVDWANLQYNGNWGLLPGNKLEFHVNIYGRKRTSSNWAQPIPLPKLPGTFNNKPLSKTDRGLLIKAFQKYLE